MKSNSIAESHHFSCKMMALENLCKKVKFRDNTQKIGVKDTAQKLITRDKFRG